MENNELQAHWGDAPVFDRDKDQLLRVQNPRAAAVKAVRDAKSHAARVQRAEDLDALLPPMHTGHSYHVLSSGNVDAMSFLEVIVRRHGPFPHLYLSTWSMSREYTNALADHINGGAIGRFTMFTGDYFAQREPANYTRIVRLADTTGGRVYRFSNHCKMFAMANEDFAAVVESSANCTTNPRTEQTVVTPDRDLYEFYATWFEDIANDRAEHRI